MLDQWKQLGQISPIWRELSLFPLWIIFFWPNNFYILCSVLVQWTYSGAHGMTKRWHCFLHVSRNSQSSQIYATKKIISRQRSVSSSLTSESTLQNFTCFCLCTLGMVWDGFSSEVLPSHWWKIFAKETLLICQKWIILGLALSFT